LTVDGARAHTGLIDLRTGLVELLLDLVKHVTDLSNSVLTTPSTRQISLVVTTTKATLNK